MKITFDKSAKLFLLKTFNKAIDKDGFIIEADNPSQKVLTQDGEQILVRDFGGIKKGSEIYLKSDLISTIKLADDLALINGTTRQSS